MVSRAGSDPRRPVGRLLTAMVTPFDSNRALDLAAAADLADYLVTEQRNDALVINGTTGEAPTTSDAEKADLVRAVVDGSTGGPLSSPASAPSTRRTRSTWPIRRPRPAPTRCLS